ncbi:glycosyltransferase family 9 protein [Actinomycetes bacterium KLBMP 9797]
MRDLVPDVGRIAVLRANSLGDFVFALPALESLRAAYPDAELVLLGAPWHARWLTGRPGPVDRVLVVPPGDGIRPAEPDEPPVGAVRERFDLAIQLHGGGANSNPIVAALGARVTAGLRAPGAPPLDRWIRYVYHQPEVFRYLEVVELVGAAPVTTTPRLGATPAEMAEARAVAGRPTRPRVALHPGATDPRRRWPVERFAAVADALAGGGFEVVATGTPGEREVVAGLVAAARKPVRPLVGALSLGGLVGLYAECAALVANDTGPLHVAAALGTPTVGIYTPSNYINGATPWRARHRPIASWIIHCPVCGVDLSHPGSGDCPHRVSMVTAVTVGEVLEAVLDVTGPRATAPAANGVGRGSAR